MKQLTVDESIFILAADKGRSKVVMNREDYVQKATELLEDQESYRKRKETQ